MSHPDRGVSAVLGQARWRHPSAIVGLAYADRGKLLVSTCSERLRVWEVPSGRSRVDRRGELLAPAVSFDGRTIGIISRRLHVYDARTGEDRLDTPGGRNCKVAVFTRDGRHLLGGTDTGSIIAYELETGSIAAMMGVHSGAVLGLAVMPKGDAIFTVGHNGSIARWLLSFDNRRVTKPTWRAFGAYAPGVEVHACSLAMPPNAQWLAVGLDNGGIALLRPDTGKTFQRLTSVHRGRVTRLVASSNGDLLVSVSEDRKLAVWQPEAAGVARLTLDLPSEPAAVAIAPRGQEVAVAFDVAIARWDSKGKRIDDAESPLGAIEAVAWAPGGESVALGSSDGRVQLWLPRTGRLERQVRHHPAPVRGVSFSRGGSTLASCGDVVWMDKVRSKDGKVFTGPQGELAAVAYASAGLELAVAVGREVVVRQESGNIWRHRRHIEAVRCLVWNPRRHELASGGDDGRITLCNGADGRVTASFAANTDGVTALAYAPNGGIIVSGGRDWLLRLWDRGQARQVLEHGIGVICGIGFAHGGDSLVAVGASGLAVWDVETLERVHAVPLDRAEPRAMAVSPDGRFVVTGLSDTTALVWDLDSIPRADLIATLIREIASELRARRDDGAAFTGGGYRQAPRQAAVVEVVAGRRDVSMRDARGVASARIDPSPGGFRVQISSGFDEPEPEAGWWPAMWRFVTTVGAAKELVGETRSSERARARATYHDMQWAGRLAEGVRGRRHDVERAERALTLRLHTDRLPDAKTLLRLIDRTRDQLLAE